MVELRLERHRSTLGYVLARPEWGHGLMTELVQAVVELVLTQSEIYRISAVCDVENIGSVRVLALLQCGQQW